MDELESAPSVGPVCPWCSAALPAADAANCPACGANLAGDTEVELPGVTTFDQETRMRLALTARPAPPPPPRRGFLGWMSGDDAATGTVAGLDPETAAILQAASAEPPSADVRREMARLEMEALVLEMAASQSALVEIESMTPEAVESGPDAPVASAEDSAESKGSGDAAESKGSGDAAESTDSGDADDGSREDDDPVAELDEDAAGLS